MRMRLRFLFFLGLICLCGIFLPRRTRRLGNRCQRKVPARCRNWAACAGV